MPALDNPRHERFAQLVAPGTNNSEAYRSVYPDADARTSHSAAAALIASHSVQARIAEINAQSQPKPFLTLERKRELLLAMAEGKVPTKTVVKPDYVEETFNRLGSIELDGKFAGELDGSSSGSAVMVNVNLLGLTLDSGFTSSENRQE